MFKLLGLGTNISDKLAIWPHKLAVWPHFRTRIQYKPRVQFTQSNKVKIILYSYNFKHCDISNYRRRSTGYVTTSVQQINYSHTYITNAGDKKRIKCRRKSGAVCTG